MAYVVDPMTSWKAQFVVVSVQNLIHKYADSMLYAFVVHVFTKVLHRRGVLLRRPTYRPSLRPSLVRSIDPASLIADIYDLLSVMFVSNKITRTLAKLSLFIRHNKVIFAITPLVTAP